ELLRVEILPRIEHGFGHHVFETGLANEMHDLAALLDRERHRDGAHDVLPRLQGGHRHPAVVAERRIDMDEVNVGIGQDLAEALVAAVNAERIADLVERNTRPATDRVHVCPRMPLIDGNELRPEAETDDRDIDPVFLHGSHLDRISNGYRDNRLRRRLLLWR